MSAALNVLIVDDELPARERLQRLVERAAGLRRRRRVRERRRTRSRWSASWTRPSCCSTSACRA